MTVWSYVILGVVLLIVLAKPVFFLGALGAVKFFQSRRIKFLKSQVESSTESGLENQLKVQGQVKGLQKLKAQKFFIIEGLMRYVSVRIGYLPSHALRKFLYRHIFAMEIGKNVAFYGRTEIWEPHKIKVGEGTIVGDGAFLDGRYGIDFGKHVDMGIGIKIFTNQHDVNDPAFGTEGKYGKVTVGDRVWLSAGCIILPKVTIGEGAVIAAGSVVTKDVEAFGIYGGVPAKKIGERNPNLTYEFDGNHLWFY